MKQNTKAKTYYDKALEIYENPKYVILPNNKAILYSSLTDFYYAQKDFEQSILYGKKALELTQQFDHPEIRKEVYDMLFKAYLELGQKEESKHYAKLYTQLKDSLTKNERQAVNTSVNKESKTTFILLKNRVQPLAFHRKQKIKSLKKLSCSKSPKTF